MKGDIYDKHKFGLSNDSLWGKEQVSLVMHPFAITIKYNRIGWNRIGYCSRNIIIKCHTLLLMPML